MTLIVKKPFRPTGTGSRMLTVGEEFMPATKAQEKLFLALGRIEAKVPEVAAPKPEQIAPTHAPYRTRMIVPETVPVEPPVSVVEPPPEAKPKRQYRRRDLVADTE